MCLFSHPNCKRKIYCREHQYDKEGLGPEERGKRRQDLKSKEMLITLRQHLKMELDKDPSETTPYLRAALKYLDKFWDNIFAFLRMAVFPLIIIWQRVRFVLWLPSAMQCSTSAATKGWRWQLLIIASSVRWRCKDGPRGSTSVSFLLKVWLSE